MGRKLLADANLPNKLKNNEQHHIKPCQYSYECVSRIFLNGQMVCASDVGLGKKDKNYSNKNLIIVGAGPAGLELALQAAKRNVKVWKDNNLKTNESDLKLWWDKINNWKKIDCLHFTNNKKEIKPQYAVQRLYELTKDKKKI